MGVLLQGFFGNVGGAGGAAWWDHLAGQARELGRSGFTAIWLPPPLKGASGGLSNGYDAFDDYDLGSKQQQGTIPTRYGTREQLARCAATMRANGIDLYCDLVENQRDGDDGHFNFRYKDAFGEIGKGRFGKTAVDFHPHVPEDPGVFTDLFSFGRDLAPINGGIPKGACGEQLIAAADWLTRALDLQGYRLDNTKGVSTVFVTELLQAKSMIGKFAVGEFADGNLNNLLNWSNAVQHRSASFDFPLHFMLKDMCNNPGGFAMWRLDHAGLVGVDPLGAVTFVENHDTDRGGIGGPIVRNKLLAYAYILTSEGYPCVFYRDYSKDPNCFGLKDRIDRLIWIHERVASGETVQRWKDDGVFAFERLGGSHLLVALNRDEATTRTITVQTGFPSNTQLQNLTDDHAPRITTDGRSMVNIAIPKNAGGKGYVCYGVPAHIAPFQRTPISTTQAYEGAEDLDIRPAIDGQTVEVCRVFPEANTPIRVHFQADTAHWTSKSEITVAITSGAEGAVLEFQKFDRSSQQKKSFSAQVKQKTAHTLSVQAANMPPEDKMLRYMLAVTYTASQTL
jgi:alpha-amylase